MTRKVVAVTGGIGCGKSTVCQILQQKGYKVVSCDELARQVSCRDDVLQDVQALLGDNAVVNGALDRKYVREMVFADKQLLDKYNKLFFDNVKALLDQQVNDCANEVVFVEIPVFYAFEYDWYQVWLVTSNKQTQLQRVVARDGVSRQNVESIIKNQRFPTQNVVVVSNDGTVEQLKEQIALLVCRLSGNNS